MASYPYSPLDLTENSIRLLRIKKGWRPDDIICWLFELNLDREQPPTYQALSYTWGNTQDTQQTHVFIDDHKFSVTENLYAAPRKIRRQEQDVILWVDAICINQEDKREKGHQVKQMGDVYTIASEVLIWLGPSSGDSNALMGSITWIDDRATESQAIGSNEDWEGLCRRFMGDLMSKLDSEAYSRQILALKELLQRPWFNRIWVLQEVAKARTARVLCGPNSCPARTFALMPSLMGIGVNEHVQSVLDIVTRLRKNTWWSTTKYLHFLLNKFAESQASVTRDKIYALLGMSEDAYHPERFYPCYEKSDAQVFRDTTCFLLFGEILDSSHSLPEFTLQEIRLPIPLLAVKVLSWTLDQRKELRHPDRRTEIRLPIPLLAEKGLSWTLGRKEELRDPARRTTTLLVDRMNEGQLKIADILLQFAESHGQLDPVRNLLSYENVALSVDFEDQRDTLGMNSGEVTAAPKRLNSPQQEPKDPQWILPEPPFNEDENMAETINRLVQTGSSKEEILRAHVWAGDLHTVRAQLDAGADVNGADANGSTALHYAAWRGHREIIELLLERGVDVNREDRLGRNALSYAALVGLARDL